VARRVDADGGLGFEPGRGRPWGRVARVKLRGKVKSSEWSNFGVEQLLGAANGDGCRGIDETQGVVEDVGVAVPGFSTRPPRQITWEPPGVGERGP
jgi:hypothetical protein